MRCVTFMLRRNTSGGKPAGVAATNNDYGFDWSLGCCHKTPLKNFRAENLPEKTVKNRVLDTTKTLANKGLSVQGFQTVRFINKG